MIYSTIQTTLMPTCFGLLFLLMLFYWSQAAMFSYIQYTRSTFLLLILSILSLTSLLLLRWIESGHFPLSNLYESLLFLSWSFLMTQLALLITSRENLQSNQLQGKSGVVGLNFVQANNIQLNHVKVKNSNNSKVNLIKKEMKSVAKEPTLKESWLGFQGGTPESELCSGNRNYVPEQSRRTPPQRVTPPEGGGLGLEWAQTEWVSGPSEGKYNVTGTQFDLLGVITSPMALLTYSFAFFTLPKEMQKATALVPALQSNWLMMHVSIMILSYAALLCGSIISITFLLLTSFPSSSYLAFKFDYFKNAANLNRVQVTGASRAVAFRKQFEHSDSRTVTPIQLKSEGDAEAEQSLGNQNIVQAFENVQPDLENRRTTNKQASNLFQTNLKNEKIVSADTSYLVLTEKLDNLSYRILGLGFPLLTMGILSGAVWANEAWGSYWSWDPKETWAFITWLVFAIYLHARITKGWSGRKPALIATFGFFVVWFCYLGVNLLGTGLHSYGWFSNSFK